MIIVTIDSDYEEVTAACQEYRASELIPALEALGATVRAFSSGAATRERVAKALKVPDVVFVSGSGHGTETRFTGDRRQPILEVGGYVAAEVAGRIVHLLACLTGETLGPDLVAHGCAAFFGYDVVFIFPLDAPEAFLECDSEIDRALAEGRTAAEAYDAAQERFAMRVEELLAAGQPYLAAMLDYNREHLCAPSRGARWGSTAARLSVPSPVLPA